VSAYGVTSSSHAVWQERSPGKSSKGNLCISLGAVTYSSPDKIPNWGPHEKLSAYPGVDNSKVIDNDVENRHVSYACGTAGGPSLPNDQAWEISLCPVIVLSACVVCVYLRRCVRARAHVCDRVCVCVCVRVCSVYLCV